MEASAGEHPEITGARRLLRLLVALLGFSIFVALGVVMSGLAWLSYRRSAD